MAKWWECSPPIQVPQVEFQPELIRGLVLSLLQGFFFQVLWISSLLKKLAWSLWKGASFWVTVVYCHGGYSRWEYQISSNNFYCSKWIHESSYIWTVEKDMKIWLIIAVIHTTSCEIKTCKKCKFEWGCFITYEAADYKSSSNNDNSCTKLLYIVTPEKTNSLLRRKKTQWYNQYDNHRERNLLVSFVWYFILFNFVKVPMKWKIICAYLKALSKYRRMVFFFLKYLFSF